MVMSYMDTNFFLSATALHQTALLLQLMYVKDYYKNYYIKLYLPNTNG